MSNEDPRAARSLTTRMRVVAAAVLTACAMGCATRSQVPARGASAGSNAGTNTGSTALPPVSNTMYDWDLPPVISVEPIAVECAPLAKGKRLEPPDPETLAIVECIDHYAPIAAEVLRRYETSEVPAVRDACANILSRLWQRRLLPAAIKHRLVGRYFQLSIAQLPLPRQGLSLQVSATPTFPFPPAVFTVRSMMYHNGRAERGLNSVSKRAVLSQPGQITSLGTGISMIGHTYAYDIVLDEMVGNRVVWRMVLRTDWITIRDVSIGSAPTSATDRVDDSRSPDPIRDRLPIYLAVSFLSISPDADAQRVEATVKRVGLSNAGDIARFVEELQRYARLQSSGQEAMQRAEKARSEPGAPNPAEEAARILGPLQTEAVATYQRLLERLTPDGGQKLKAFVIREFRATGAPSFPGP